ncbi:hypothetical protein EHJ37_19695 [Vibrio parahaemolyticus]|nr:hypothetical protein [Vibrio parahaemolyticus]
MGAEESAQMRKLHNKPAPQGNSISATLKGKSWGKSTNLNCFFETDDGVKFVISAFRSRDGKMYGPRDMKEDLSQIGNVGTKYILEINQGPRSKYPSLISAIKA